MTADEIARATGGTRHGSAVTVVGVTIDSRVVTGGELFVPVAGERDGHDFIVHALEAGAAAYLTAREPQGGTAIAVVDHQEALLDLGRYARTRLPDTVIGITGSVGKTSVKDLTAGALRSARRTAASERSFNNELGVPLTLLNAADDVEAVVVEMGARGQGHIALLADVARPTIGVVTTVALAHAEFFGTIEDVAVAKSELVASLPASGTAVLNADDPRVLAMASRTEARVITFGRAGDVTARDVRIDDALRPSFTLESPWGSVGVALAVSGAHQVANALAAAAAALAAGVDLADVAEGLAGAELSPMRMALSRTATGAWVLNDAYNANPASMTAALEALAALPAKRRVACLGFMAELGDATEREHRRIATVAKDLGIEVIAIETDAYGVEPSTIDGAVDRLGPLEDGDAVLVKASRVAALERLADRLLQA